MHTCMHTYIHTYIHDFETFTWRWKEVPRLLCWNSFSRMIDIFMVWKYQDPVLGWYLVGKNTGETSLKIAWVVNIHVQWERAWEIYDIMKYAKHVVYTPNKCHILMQTSSSSTSTSKTSGVTLQSLKDRMIDPPNTIAIGDGLDIPASIT